MSLGRVTKREWTAVGPLGRPVTRVAYGFTVRLPDGERVCRSDATWTREDAHRALAATVLEGKAATQRRGPRLEPATAPEPAATYGEVARRFRDTKRAEGKRSTKAYERIFRHLLETLGADTPAAAVTTVRVTEWKVARASAVSLRMGRRLAAASVNRPLAVLRAALRFAADEGMIPAPPKVRLLREPEGRVVWLEPDEEARLLAECRASRNPDLLPFGVLGLETGLRKGELLGLEWGAVDFSRNVVRVDGRRTKNHRRREVPLRDRAYEALASLPAPHERRVRRTRDIRRAFDNAVKRAKLDVALACGQPGPFTLHGLRHHFASWFVMRGGSLPALQRLLGHATLHMTLRYAHLAPASLRDEVLKTAAPGTIWAQDLEGDALVSVSAGKTGAGGGS